MEQLLNGFVCFLVLFQVSSGSKRTEVCIF